MIKKIYFTLIGGCLVFIVSAQPSAELWNQTYASENIYTFDNRYSGVKGSPYLSQDWLPAEMTMRSAKKEEYHIDKVSIKIDAFNHQVYVRPKMGNSIIVVDKGVVAVKLLTPDSLVVKTDVVGDKPVFYATLWQGDLELRQIYGRTFREADYKGAYSSGRTFDEFKVTDYLYAIKGSKSEKVKSNKKFWTSYFPNKKQEIAQYFKSNEVKTPNQVLAMLMAIDN